MMTAVTGSRVPMMAAGVLPIEIDGDGHEEKRQYRWQQSQLGSTEPLFRRLKHLYRLARNKRIDEHRDESEH